MRTQELTRIIDTIVAAEAGAIDAEGRFPKRAVDELAADGWLALTVPSQYGGAGLGLREAADVVRTLGGACGSTAIIVAMHHAANGDARRRRSCGDAPRDRRRAASQHPCVL